MFCIVLTSLLKSNTQLYHPYVSKFKQGWRESGNNALIIPQNLPTYSEET